MRQLRGGVSSPGFCGRRRRRSVEWERGESKRACGMGLWGLSSARARARGGRRPRQGALHGGVAVAAMRRHWAAWHCRGGSSAQPRAVEKLWGDAWAPAQRRTWPGRLSPAPATALHSGGGGKTEQGAGGGRKGCFAISKNSRDQNVNKQ